MIFGTVFTGQIKTYKKQCIETKLFCFILPIYPIMSMLVTEYTTDGRAGIEIKTNKLSILAAVLRMISTLLFIFSSIAFIANFSDMPWLFIPCIISLPLFIFFWFFFGKTTEHENFEREQFGKVLGLYLMAEWLEHHTKVSYHGNLKLIYLKQYGTYDWQEKLKSTAQFDPEFPLLYCLVSLENSITPNRETELWLRGLSKQAA